MSSIRCCPRILLRVVACIDAVLIPLNQSLLGGLAEFLELLCFCLKLFQLLLHFALIRFTKGDGAELIATDTFLGFFLILVVVIALKCSSLVIILELIPGDV